ncbi:MAG: primosomal protein N' [Candidatus Babeliaceae bacterium]|nr:primosomal protein N' [Candidatus Babeliaceae bacterium]
MKYAEVILLKGPEQILTYAIPDSLESEVSVGSLVTVPLQRRFDKGIVTAIQHELPKTTFSIRPIIQSEPFPADTHYQHFIETIAAYYRLEPIVFYKRLRTFVYQKEKNITYASQSDNSPTEQVILTSAQQKIVDSISHNFNPSQYAPTLLHGVTSSGKTEVYVALMKQALAAQRSILFLLPDVSLAVRFCSLLKAKLPPETALFGFHSATGANERRALWQRLCKGLPTVIIGVHLPVLLPIAQLGLIVVDEEHDVGYQEKKHPKINTRECALLRASQLKIPILLGSATPSIHSFYNVQQKKWALFTLSERFGGASFPTIKMVNLCQSKKRASPWISAELANTISDRLIKKEQSILFLNRRGHSFFIQCRTCGFIFCCPNCSVSLTYHENKTLRCHYCDHQTEEAIACPHCRNQDLIKRGIGTQQLTTQVQHLFPQARIARADLDTTVNKKRWSETMRQFHEGTIDILIGTQTITRGYHFPRVTLVGIIWADINLSLPQYNATETTLQQLIQVAGRAGRASQESLVLVQTLGNHPVLKFFDELRFHEFYTYESHFRKTLSYPPFIRFAELELRNSDLAKVNTDAHACAFALKEFQKKEPNLIVLGPANPPVETIKGISRRLIYLKAPTFAIIHAAYEQIPPCVHASTIFFTPNPIQ